MIIESRLFGHVENSKKLTEKIVRLTLLNWNQFGANNGEMIYVTKKSDVVLVEELH